MISSWKIGCLVRLGEADAGEKKAADGVRVVSLQFCGYWLLGGKKRAKGFVLTITHSHLCSFNGVLKINSSFDFRLVSSL